MKKRVLTVCVALVLAVALGVLAYAADGNLYSVSVSGKNISFVSGGRVVGTYQASSTDLKLMTAGTYTHPDRGTPFDEHSKEDRDEVQEEPKNRNGSTRGER